MAGSTLFWGIGRLASLVVGLAISASAHAQYPAGQQDGPIFSAQQMKQGISMTAQDCAAYRSTVYVVASGAGLCFRYYLSNAGGSSSDAVYYLHGDVPDEDLAYDPAKLDHTAERMSKAYGRPAIYLARMGMQGSSGSKRYRRTWFEIEATYRAIDAINARHGFRMIHVMGQSGGGHLTGALTGLRSDIGCAVPGSGRLAFDDEYKAAQAKRAPELRHYSPDSNLAQIIRQSLSTRILVVTDPNDRRVPAHTQTGFVRAVQMGGGRVAQFFVTATDDLSHGATAFAYRAMAGCLQGKSDQEIAASLDKLSQERMAKKIASQGGGQPSAVSAPATAAPPAYPRAAMTAQPFAVSTPPAPPSSLQISSVYPPLPVTGPARSAYAGVGR